MSRAFSISPDPAHPGGGHARLHFPPGAVTGPTVDLTVFGLFREKYLGPGGWQPVPARFGAYAVQPDANGGALVVIGPEIVNAMEEFVSVRFDTGSFQAVATWPETVSPDQDALPVGTIRVPGTPEPDNRLIGQHTATSATTPPAVPEQPASTGGDDPVENTNPTVSTPIWRKWWLWAVLGVLLAGAVALAVFWPGNDPEPVPAPPPLPPAVPTATCSLDSVTASGADLAARLSGAADLLSDGTCDAGQAADLGLALIERGAADNDPAALLLFGRIYDPGVRDDLAQDRLGIRLAEDAAVALDYYRRAADAGAPDAQAALGDLCGRTVDAADPLIAATHQELCP